MWNRFFVSELALAALLFAMAVYMTGCGSVQPNANTGSQESFEKDQRIKDLETQLKQVQESYSAERTRDWAQIRDLNKGKCGRGEIENGGSNYDVATFDKPELVIERMDRMYLENNPSETVDRKEPVSVKNVPMYTGPDNYPDVVCFVFKGGAKSCFDPMEITER